MKGLELSYEFYLAFGKEAIEKNFPLEHKKIAVGLVGRGSECFGFDDEISTDHDFEPGFCLFVTKEDYKEFGFKLEKVYRSRPEEFRGFKRQKISPVGGNRHSVLIIEDFYSSFIGTPNAPESFDQWFYIPHEALASVTNGRVFKDELGVFSSVREKLLLGYPFDVKLKKICDKKAYKNFVNVSIFYLIFL